MPHITFKNTTQYQLPIIDICERTNQKANQFDWTDLTQQKEASSFDKSKLLDTENIDKNTPSTVWVEKEETVQIEQTEQPLIKEEFFIQDNKSVKKQHMEPSHQKMEIVSAVGQFSPRAVVCFSSDSNENVQTIGLTFAQEAKAFKLKKQSNLNEKNPFTQKKNISINSIGQIKEIPVITKSISGTRFIYDTVSLYNYCVKWCKSVYFGRVILRAIHNTGTLLLIFPGKAAHYIQFVYKNNPLSEIQRQFQSEIMPADVEVFRSFADFSSWMKKQVPCDA